MGAADSTPDVSVAGLDGCRGGWVMAVVPLHGPGPSLVEVVTGLAGAAAALECGRLTAAAVDIPIGLPASGRRPADAAARRLLGPRRSSVFPTPVRAVLGARDYADACARSRAACGKAISKQLFHILDKIAEADAVVSPARQRRFVEVCPELSFALLAGAPMRHAKSTAPGRAERVRALAHDFPDAATHAAHPPRPAKADDVLDAFACAWTARRFATGVHLHLGGERDETGLRMEMIA